jgi:hypothetical protein
MVQIVGFKTYQNEDGEDFNVLVVQGGLEVVKSAQSGRNYVTVKILSNNKIEVISCKWL